MNDHARIDLTEALRAAAADFDRLAGESADTRLHADLMEHAGRLVIAAQQCGYLADIDGLSELVEWATDATATAPHPYGWPETFARCPLNVFSCLAGLNGIPLRIVDGKAEATGPVTGGLLPTAMPAIYDGSLIFDPSKPAGSSVRSIERHYAQVCRALASRIETLEGPQRLAQRIEPKPALTETGRLILKVLLGAGNRLVQADIGPRCERSRSAVQSELVQLEKQGLVDRAAGKRRGYALTDAGRALFGR